MGSLGPQKSKMKQVNDVRKKQIRKVQRGKKKAGECTEKSSPRLTGCFRGEDEGLGKGKTRIRGYKTQRGGKITGGSNLTNTMTTSDWGKTKKEKEEGIRRGNIIAGQLLREADGVGKKHHPDKGG